MQTPFQGEVVQIFSEVELVMIFCMVTTKTTILMEVRHMHREMTFFMGERETMSYMAQRERTYWMVEQALIR